MRSADIHEMIEDLLRSRVQSARLGLNMPGQAGSYFYGYSRILQLRAETELALGAKFDRLKFNNFLLDQGMLPPDLLAKAARERFSSQPKRSETQKEKPAGTATRSTW